MPEGTYPFNGEVAEDRDHAALNSPALSDDEPAIASA
jgi:hypothetical protein